MNKSCISQSNCEISFACESDTFHGFLTNENGLFNPLYFNK